MNSVPQIGGAQRSSLTDIQNAGTAGIFMVFVLTIAFPHIVKDSQIRKLSRTPLGQILFIAIIFAVAYYISPIAGLFSALTFLFIWSLSMEVVVAPAPEKREGFLSIRPTLMLNDSNTTGIVPDKHKWFVESVLEENPLLITEKTVKTSAIQDNSQGTMVNSHTSR
jgi:hypothetical protein